MTDIGTPIPVSVTLGQRAEALSQRSHVADATEQQKIAADFEGIFISMLLKEMRQTVGGDGLFAGDASDTYGGMFDMFLGQHLAAQGGLGIRDMILKYLDYSKT
ncbi:MAG: rod-binding protein [Planctomycetaceae bacterium]